METACLALKTLSSPSDLRDSVLRSKHFNDLSIFLSLSCHPVVGRGERRGPADLLPDGNRVEEDPRLVRLLHLRHHRQHRHPLHPAEGGVTMFLTVLQKRRKKKRGEKHQDPTKRYRL